MWSIIFSKVIGPHIFKVCLLGSSAFFKTKCLYFLRTFLWWHGSVQHDGAAPHFSWLVTDFLQDSCSGCWIGRGGPVAWLPRYPDLNPHDFYLWDHIKLWFIKGIQPMCTTSQNIWCCWVNAECSSYFWEDDQFTATVSYAVFCCWWNKVWIYIIDLSLEFNSLAISRFINCYSCGMRHFQLLNFEHP